MHQSIEPMLAPDQALTDTETEETDHAADLGPVLPIHSHSHYVIPQHYGWSSAIRFEPRPFPYPSFPAAGVFRGGTVCYDFNNKFEDAWGLHIPWSQISGHFTQAFRTPRGVETRCPTCSSMIEIVKYVFQCGAGTVESQSLRSSALDLTSDTVPGNVGDSRSSQENPVASLQTQIITPTGAPSASIEVDYGCDIDNESVDSASTGEESIFDKPSNTAERSDTPATELDEAYDGELAAYRDGEDEQMGVPSSPPWQYVPKRVKHAELEFPPMDKDFHRISIDYIRKSIKHAYEMLKNAVEVEGGYPREFYNNFQHTAQPPFENELELKLWEFPIRNVGGRWPGVWRVIFDDNGNFVGFTEKMHREKYDPNVRRVQHEREEYLREVPAS